MEKMRSLSESKRRGTNRNNAISFGSDSQIGDLLLNEVVGLHKYQLLCHKRLRQRRKKFGECFHWFAEGSSCVHNYGVTNRSSFRPEISYFALADMKRGCMNEYLDIE